jgi:hypothetical protein
MSLEAALPRPTRFSIGRVLGDSIGIFARNAIWVFAITCGARVVVLLVPSDYEASLPWSDQLIGDLARTLASALGDAAIPLGAMQILNGRRASVRDVTTGLRHVIAVTIATIIYSAPWTLSIFVDALWESGSDTESLVRWLVVYAIGMVLYVRWAVATQANVLDKLGAFAGLARSARLTKGHRWAIFGVTMIPLVVIYALHAGAAILPGIMVPDLDVSQADTLERAADYFISALSSAYFAVQTTVLYYYLRREKDGVESDEIAHVFD